MSEPKEAEPIVPHRTMSFNSPSYCLVTIRGNDIKKGTVRIVGRDVHGQTIEEPIKHVPAIPSSIYVQTMYEFYYDYEIHSIHAYREVSVYTTGLEGAEVIVGGYTPQRDIFYVPQSQLSQQERNEIKRIAREAAQEVIREMVNDLKINGPRS